MSKKRAKKATTKPKAATPAKRQKAQRRNWEADETITTHKANGGIPESHAMPVDAPEKVPVGEAVRKAIEALGPITIEDTIAPQQMRELGDCFETVERAKAIFASKSEDAKSAKKTYDAAVENLLERVKTFTHLPPLPLFDNAEAESDREDMLDAIDKGGAVEEAVQ